MYKKELLMAYCPWSLHDDFSKIYHDTEWCRLHNDDSYLFEMLVLEGASCKVSRDLKKRGCTFAGPVIIYSFLQAAGLIDDHLITCPFHSENRK